MRGGVAKGALAAFLLVWSTAPARADSDDPNLMLERMTAAMSQMSYQGTFVYVQGERVETMRITHVADGKGVRERLVALSGPPREVLRDSNGVRWVLSDDGSVLEDSAFNRSFFPQLPLDPGDQASRSYILKTGASARIAGHQARNLKILPKDEYRYGYSLWLEKHSGLLLKWELIDHERKPLAKLMFTEVRLGSEVDTRELAPDTRLKKYKTVESSLPSGAGVSQARPRWLPGTVPPGFRLTTHRYASNPDHGEYEHLVYSDGLAAVSVYVEKGAKHENPEAGVRLHGTTHTFSRVSDEFLITVVGDVPAVTVKSIGNAVESVSR